MLGLLFFFIYLFFLMVLTQPLTLLGQHIARRLGGHRGRWRPRIYDCLDAAMAGLGVAYAPMGLVQPYIGTGHLISVLEDWIPL